MKNLEQLIFKTIPSLFAIVSVVLAPLSQWCNYVSRMCYGTWSHRIYQPFTQPLYNFSILALFIAAIVIFIPWNIFKSWLKFSAIVLPLAFLYIALTPVSATRLGIDFFPYYRINAAHDAGIAFVISSLLFIAWKYWRNRRQGLKI